MKKLYTLAFMAVSALTVAATDNVAALKDATAAPDFEIAPIRTATVTAAPRHAAAKVVDYSTETWKSLGEGKYVASAIADCYGGSKDAADVEVFEAEGKSGLYKVVGVWADILESTEGTLYIDATDPEFVLVNKQITGITDNVDGVTYIASLSAVAIDEYDIDKAAFLANFADQNAYVDNGVIIFPAGSLVLQWPEAPEDSKYGTDATKWYNYAKTDGRLVLPGAEYVDPWGEAVEATMVETILSPVFLDSYSSSPYNVKVQKNNETGAYRIIEPWSQLYKALNFNGKSPNLEIDATDPTNLVIELQETGISGGATAGAYMIMSKSYYNLLNELETEDAEKITLTDNNDGTSTIKFPYHSTLMYAATSQKIYYASADQTGSTITFKTFSAGVNDIITDTDVNAPVEYFNLQGMRVDAPAAGQLVIKRQGSKVSKEIVR